MIFDDHAAVVAGVRCWCARADPPIELLVADDRLARVWTGPGLTADVVIVDLDLLVRRQGFGALRRLVEVGRRVVVYSRYTDPATALRCEAAGVCAYLSKREGEAHLVAAIRAAAAGRTYHGPAAAGVVGDRARGDRPMLSPRELEVLRVWFSSPSKQLVAAKLHISVKTVDTHIERVRVKYANTGRAAPTKSELVTRVLGDGLVSMEDLTR
ncbi:LuxR C-terminal-related transcriptional regulator [Actinophytocola sediminis]